MLTQIFMDGKIMMFVPIYSMYIYIYMCVCLCLYPTLHQQQLYHFLYEMPFFSFFLFLWSYDDDMRALNEGESVAKSDEVPSPNVLIFVQILLKLYQCNL